MQRFKFLVLALVLLAGLLTACYRTSPDPVIQTQPADAIPEASTSAETIPETTEATQPAVISHAVPETEMTEEHPHSESPGDASGFVLVTDVIPDAILEIRYHSTYNFIGDRIDGYEEPVALLTYEAAEALKAVSDALEEQGYRIKIFDAYRPQMAVDHFVRWAEDIEDIRMKAYFYPDVPKTELFSRGYIASRSGHSRGSTVDLTLFDMKTGREVDMGGTFDFFGERSHGDYPGLTEEQAANRRLLRDTMTAHGFRSLGTEWWHFTLKDEPYPDIFFTFPVSTDAVLRDTE